MATPASDEQAETIDAYFGDRVALLTPTMSPDMLLRPRTRDER